MARELFNASPQPRGICRQWSHSITRDNSYLRDLNLPPEGRERSNADAGLSPEGW